MTYSVKEMFLTLQGEGAQAGRTSIFIRFSGCNLWSGLEKDRETARCNFCDTDFVGTDGKNGGKFKTAKELVQKACSLWLGEGGNKYCVLTGGEPLLQVDKELIDALHEENFFIAIETNGTKTIPEGIDWVCMSPKAGEALSVFQGDEIKLVYPQEKLFPKIFEDLEFNHFFLQPMDNQNQKENTKLAIEYCLKNPKWRLSVQTHKILGID